MDKTSGELFREIREEMGYKPEELARLLGVSYNYFYNIEVKSINPSTSIRDELIRMYLESANGDRGNRVVKVRTLFAVLAEEYKKRKEERIRRSVQRLFLEPMSKVA
jgi:DNA-binding XRE family transcriptional regulator